MQKSNYKNISRAIIILIIAILGAKEIYLSQKYSSSPSPYAAMGAEANVIRAGECYNRDGFRANAGLPDIWCEGNFFPEEGGIACGPKHKTNIYKTYPPGSHLLAGVYTMICGVGNLGCSRLFPLAIGIISMAILARILFYAMNPIKSALMILAIAIVPMASNKMHGLQFQSYTLPLLLICLGVMVNYFRKKNAFNGRYFIIFSLIGFLQGWLSFDYIFIVSFSAFPIALIYSPLNNKKDFKRFVYAMLSIVAGLCFAYILHFIQVIIYDVSLEQTFEFMSTMFKERHDDSGGGEVLEINALWLAARFFVYYSSHWHLFYIMNPAVLMVVVCLLLSVKEWTRTIQKPLPAILKWISNRRYYIVVLSSLFISLLWVLIMKQHAYLHKLIIGRHLFLFYFISILTMLECISLEPLDREEESHVSSDVS